MSLRVACPHLSELLGIISGIAHGIHTSSKLRGKCLLKGSEEARVEVEGEEGVKDLGWLLLKDQARVQSLSLNGLGLTGHVELSTLAGELEDLVVGSIDAGSVDVAELPGGSKGKEGLDGGVGGDEGDKLGVAELNLVTVLGHKAGEELVRDGLGILHGGGLAEGKLLDNVELGAPLHVLLDLPSDGHNLDVAPEVGELLEPLLGLLEDEVVVASAESTVASDDNEENGLDGADGAEGRVNILILDPLVDAKENLDEVLREGAGADHGLLSAANLGSSDELHGLMLRCRGSERVSFHRATTRLLTSVILEVFLTDAIRSRTSFIPATTCRGARGVSLLHGALEALNIIPSLPIDE
jgi:hypothetical protein